MILFGSNEEATAVHTEASSHDIERRLTNLLPSESLEDHAEAVGVVEREGKLQIPPLVWSFAFGFAIGETERSRHLAHLQLHC